MRSWYSDFPGASGKSNLMRASCIILPSGGHWQKFASKSLHPTGLLPYPEGLSWGPLSQTHRGAWGPAEKLETAGCGPGSLRQPLLHSPPAHLTAAAVPAQPADSKASKTNQIPTRPRSSDPKVPWTQFSHDGPHAASLHLVHSAPLPSSTSCLCARLTVSMPEPAIGSGVIMPFL